MTTARYYIPEEETLDRKGLTHLQRQKLQAMLEQVMRYNPFYKKKLGDCNFDPMSGDLSMLPFTTRGELEGDQVAHPPYGTNLTECVDRYCRLHQTSGTGGTPMRWLDTQESWNWFKRCWGIIFTAAGIGLGDRVLFPFSFGPFVGFWAAFESAVSMGCLALPGGGMTTGARIKMLLDNRATVVCCTPTYALRMAEVAAEEGIDLHGAGVRALIVAGEPGGSVPEIRGRIESAWNARVFDHTGMTEIGALGFECAEAPGGVHLIESECIPEVIDPRTLEPVEDGQIGELVLTNLGRWGSPLIRYRTGDRVRLMRQRCACGRCFARLEGGILGRIDDMFIVRGNNVFPPALEAVIRRIDEVAEYRIEIDESRALTEVRIEVEPSRPCEGLARRVIQAIQDALNFRAEVRVVPAGHLPRFELKARRIVRKKAKAPEPATVTIDIHAPGLQQLHRGREAPGDIP